MWLDGGAMFGVVPRTLWENVIPPDSRHRIPLAIRCLLVETPNNLVLVDTGIGNKESEKFKEIYGVENEGNPTRLEDGLREAGFEPEDVDLVISTHLHFDHVGGNIRRDPDGSHVPSFPNARCVMQAGELAFAQTPNERVRASYMAKNFQPLVEAGLVDTVEGGTDLVEGVRLIPAPGHTPHHQCVLVGDGADQAVFLADVCPTSGHLPLPWITGYDLEPLVTLESKRSILGKAREEGWILIFQHDAETPWGRLEPDTERPRLMPLGEHDPGY